jgi:hypothetical protein
VTAPGHRRALFAAVTVAMVLGVLALGSLPAPTQVERAGAAPLIVRRDPPRATTTTTEAPPVTITPGLHAVGVVPAGVRPGVYVTTGDLCSWERRGPGGEVLAGDTGSGQVLVEVRPADTAFSSSPGCGTWRAFDGGTALATFGPGTFAVGTQVAPGRWRSDGGDLCYWERLGGLGGGLDELVASAGVPGPTEVVVAPTDAGFRSFGCGTWRPA